MTIKARLSILTCLTVLLSVALAPAAAWAEVGKRYALVIGNSAYGNAEPLPNASQDAAQMAQTLSELRFEVFAGFNLSRLSFERIINDFGQQVKKAGADTALIFYAGHGFELEGVNRLVPIDAKLNDPSAITAETFALDDIIASIQSPDRQTIIFLDACRNNPLAATLGEKYANRGLAQVRTGTNTFIAFATQPGNVSYEGSGNNSPFTEALLTNIAKPNMSLSDIMIAVRTDVSTRTIDRQVPWDQSSLRTQFYFNPVDVQLASSNAGAGGATGKGSGQGSGMTQSRSGSIQADMPKAGSDTDRTGITIGSAGAPSTTVAAVEPSQAQVLKPARAQTAAVTTLAPEPELDPEMEAEELIKPLQSELRGIGCYRGQIDGDWGPLSQAAVKQYYQKKGLEQQSLDPTAELLAAVEQESGQVCDPPKAKVAAKKQPAQKKKQAKKAAPAKKRTAAKSPPPHQPAPQPYHEPGYGAAPTINLYRGGFGIGFGIGN